MKKLYPVFYICFLLIYLSACKIDSPVFPEKPDVPTPTDTTKTPATTIDKALLTGWWAPTVTTKAQVYFGTDNFFFLDTLSKDSPPTAGFWRTSGDTIKYSQNLNGPSPATYILNKLTSDSLVVTFDGVKTAYHKLSLPAITSTAISTIAGNSIEGYSGDGNSALTAQISARAGLLVSNAGDIYFSDRANNLIRKIAAADGKITTIAGSLSTSAAGSYIPNFPATSALLSSPVGLAMDDKANIYITEYLGNRINKVSAEGKITCIAGCNTYPNPSFSGDGGLATMAGISGPQGITVDSIGNIYFADSGNNRIRKINASDGKINTIAGNGEGIYSGEGGDARLAGMTVVGLSLDAAGNIYFADPFARRIRKISKATNSITTIAGTGVVASNGDGGQATSAALNIPFGIHVDINGDVYISELLGHVIRKIDIKTGIITKIAGTGFGGFTGDGIHATAYSLDSPYALTMDNTGNIYVSEAARIRKISR
jgi:sugar lactone lactonase YvrE